MSKCETYSPGMCEKQICARSENVRTWKLLFGEDPKQIVQQPPQNEMWIRRDLAHAEMCF